MGLFKTPDEKEAEERQQRDRDLARQTQQRTAAEERERQEQLSTPTGKAEAAKQAGDRFFEIQLRVGTTTGGASFGAASVQHRTESSAQVIQKIEALGWHLEHAGYVYVMTGENSTAKMFLSGDQTAVTGMTVGVYLFRNTDDAA